LYKIKTDLSKVLCHYRILPAY